MKRNRVYLGEAVGFAWSTYKERYVLFTAGLVSLLAAWVALEVIVVVGQRFGIVLWAVAHLAFLIFFAGIEVGMLRVSLELYDGREPTFDKFFAHLAWGPRLLAGQVLYLSMVVTGLMLLLIPGVYLGTRYALFGFSIADGEKRVIESFRHSAILTTYAKARLLAILIVLVLFNGIGASLLGVGLLVTIPLSVLLMTAVYRQLSKVSAL